MDHSRKKGKIRCENCQKVGHYAKNCPEKKDKARYHIRQLLEDVYEQGLLEEVEMQIAQAQDARVSSHVFQGFGPQKNYALSLATGDWVLSVDADERVGTRLAHAIKTAVARGDADAYEMPRLSNARAFYLPSWITQASQ